MIDQELKMKKPSFIHRMILRDLGYDGPDMEMEEMFRFFQNHGIPIKNGTMSFRDYVRFAKEAGFDGIDMMAFHFDEDGISARQILEEYGITLSAVDIICEFGNAVTEEAFRQKYEETVEIMERAYEAGCRYILLVPTQYTPAPGVTREQIFHHMVRGLKACVEYGNSKGMTVGTETLESIAVPLCSIGEMKRLFESVPGLKYNHDTGNPLVALEDPVEEYMAMQELVVNVHFKDLTYTEEKTNMMDSLGRYFSLAILGEGLVDFKKHLELLKAADYQGFITLEGMRPADNQLDGAVKALEYFREMEAGL